MDHEQNAAIAPQLMNIGDSQLFITQPASFYPAIEEDFLRFLLSLRSQQVPSAISCCVSRRIANSQRQLA